MLTSLGRGALVGLCLSIAIATPARAASDQARAFVEQLGNEAVAILQPANAPADRQSRLEDLLRRAFDLDYVSKAVLGRHWNEATPEQQDEFRQVFSEFIVRSYSRRLANQTVSDFTVIAVRAAGEDSLIETEIVRPQSEPLHYGWRVRSDGQKLIDVIVEGVSLTVTHRADFASAVQQQGMDGLIAALKKKLA